MDKSSRTPPSSPSTTTAPPIMSASGSIFSPLPPGVARRRGTISMGGSIDRTQANSRIPSLIPSTSFRAAQQLPRYSRHSVAMTRIASPQMPSRGGAVGSRRESFRRKEDVFEKERETVIEAVFCLDLQVSTAPPPVKPQFLEVPFWKPEQHAAADLLAVVVPVQTAAPDHHGYVSLDSSADEESNTLVLKAKESSASPKQSVSQLALRNSLVVAAARKDSSTVASPRSVQLSVATSLPEGSELRKSVKESERKALYRSEQSLSSTTLSRNPNNNNNNNNSLPPLKGVLSGYQAAPMSSPMATRLRLLSRPMDDQSSGDDATDDESGSDLERTRFEGSTSTVESSGYAKLPHDDRDSFEPVAAPEVSLKSSSHEWLAQTPEEVRKERGSSSATLTGAPSFVSSREVGHQIVDRFHRVVELLNASPTPPVNVQLDCHREMHTLTANFRNDAIMYGRVIISEVSLPVERKTIKPLDGGGILGGDKYRVGSVYFKFALDRLNIFGGDADAAHKVAGHELKSLVQLMECGIPGLRYPLLCVIDYLGFRLIAMSTLPIRGRSSLVYGSMDGGKTVASSPETLELTKKLAKKLNLKEHGLNHHEPSLRVWTPADLELHRGTDDHVYALDFSRLFPPTRPTADPGGVFYQLFRPEFLRKWKVPLNSDAYTSFMAPAEAMECTQEIKEAHAALLELAKKFGASLEQERVATDLAMASEKLINLMHVKGINCRFLGHVRATCTSPYWRLILLLEMVLRRLKKILFAKWRKAMLQKGTPGVSVCMSVALNFVNLVIGESDDSSDFWQHVIRASVMEYFGELALSERERAMTMGFKESVCSSENGRILMADVRAQVLGILCQKTGLKLSNLTRVSVKNNPRVIRVPSPFDDADLHELGVSVTYIPIASFSGGKLKRLMAMDTSRRAKAYELNLSAAKLYAQALQMNPADAQLLRNCAEVEAALGNDVRAHEFFSLALEVDPSDAATAFKFAIFYDHAMELDLAEQWYLKAISLIEKSHRIPVMVGTYADFLLTERRDLATARKLYERILDKSPKHAQTLHNLAVLLYEEDIVRAKTLFKTALENAEDPSRVAIISRSCAMFCVHTGDNAAGLLHYSKYKELKHLVAVFPPTLYHATRSQFGPEMDEIREILGPQDHFKVRHIVLHEDQQQQRRGGGGGGGGRAAPSLRHRLERSLQSLFNRLQVPCSTEILFISVGDEQIPSWEFDKSKTLAWAEQHVGKTAMICIILGYQDGDGQQIFEESLEGTIEQPGLAEELDGWDSVFKVKGFGKTIAELASYMAMLNVRRRAYLRMWSSISRIFNDEDDEEM